MYGRVVIMKRFLLSTAFVLSLVSVVLAQAPLSIGQGGTSDGTGNPVFTTVAITGATGAISNVSGNLGSSASFWAQQFLATSATGLVLANTTSNTIQAAAATNIAFKNTNGTFFSTFDPGAAIANWLLIAPGVSGSNNVTLSTTGSDTNRSITLQVAGTGAAKARHFSGIGTVPTITTGTATLDTTASDAAGTVTEGAAQTGFTLTFAQAYATTPHCTVTSPNGAAATSYTPSTTTLAVANVSATGDVFTYVCVQ